MAGDFFNIFNIFIQRLLIYATMLLYGAGFAACLMRRRELGMKAYAMGFIMAIAAWVFRWTYVGHLPLTNLYEVMLLVGMAMYPVSVLSRRALGVGGEAVDMLIATVVLVAPGFVFDASARQLAPSLQTPLFGPHVASYMLAYAIMAKAAVQAGAAIATGAPEAAASREGGADRLA